MEEGGRGLLRRIADRQAGKGGRHRRIADRRAREEGKHHRGGGGGLPPLKTSPAHREPAHTTTSPLSSEPGTPPPPPCTTEHNPGGLESMPRPVTVQLTPSTTLIYASGPCPSSRPRGHCLRIFAFRCPTRLRP